MSERTDRPLLTIAAAMAALAATVAALSAIGREPVDDAVRLAALEAVLSHADGPRRHPELVVCVEVDTGRELLRSPGRPEDPSSDLLRAVQSIRRFARPQSECEHTAEGVRHRPSGSEAVIVGVAVPQRVSDDFYRAEAFWFYDGFGSVGWKYTVSLEDGKWRVDTEKMLWIS
jgi:hypothetical protein